MVAEEDLVFEITRGSLICFGNLMSVFRLK